MDPPPIGLADDELSLLQAAAQERAERCLTCPSLSCWFSW